MRHIDSLIVRLGNTSSPLLSNVALGLGKKWGIWPKEIFDSQIIHPFEFLTIAIPKGFDEYLRIVYGDDYMMPKHSSTSHGATILEPEIPYVEYLKSHSYAEIEQRIKELSK